MEEGGVKSTDGLGIEPDTVMYYLFISVSLEYHIICVLLYVPTQHLLSSCYDT